MGKKLLSLLVGLILFGAGFAAAEELAKPPAGQVEDKASASLWEEYLEKIGPLQDQLWAKGMEFESLLTGGFGGPPQNEIRKIISVMVNLRGQIRAERIQLFKKMREKGEAGISGWGPDLCFGPEAGPGWGYGGWGPFHRGGYGPDGPWSRKHPKRELEPKQQEGVQ